VGPGKRNAVYREEAVFATDCNAGNSLSIKYRSCDGSVADIYLEKMVPVNPALEGTKMVRNKEKEQETNQQERIISHVNGSFPGHVGCIKNSIKDS
jgi:hypothetical protein